MTGRGGGWSAVTSSDMGISGWAGANPSGGSIDTGKRQRKDLKDRVEGKPAKELVERPAGGVGVGPAQPPDLSQAVTELEARVSALPLPIPRSTRPGNSASSRRNWLATLSGL